MRKILLAAVAALAMTAAAKADLVNLGLDPTPWNLAGAAILTLDPTVPTGNQVQNLPCIICGENQPHQQTTGLGYNNFGNTGNETTVSFFSTATVGGSLGIDVLGTGYTLTDGSPLLNALGGRVSFSVGIDVNDSSQTQTLESFWFLNLTTHTVLAVYSPNPLDGTLLPDVNNGTGFPDWTLNGLTLAGISAGDQVIFYARITGANDGPDSFFLIPNAVAAVPAPMLGGGLPGVMAACLGLWGLSKRRRERNRQIA